MPTGIRLSNIWLVTKGSLYLCERILLDVALSRDGAKLHSSLFSLGPNIIFTLILFNTGCQFGLFYLQQWGRGEISSDGSYSDWQPVSSGKPHSLCFRSQYFGSCVLQPSCHSFLALSSFLFLESATHHSWTFQVLPFSKRTANCSSLSKITIVIIVFSTPIDFFYLPWIVISTLCIYSLCLPHKIICSYVENKSYISAQSVLKRLGSIYTFGNLYLTKRRANKRLVLDNLLHLSCFDCPSKYRETPYLLKLQGPGFQHGLWLACSSFDECNPCVHGLFLTNRSSMPLSHWLPGRRAKLLRTTWMSSKTNGKSRSECWQRLWMTSPQWMTSCPSQVTTHGPLHGIWRPLQGDMRNILQVSWVCVSSALFDPLSFQSSLQLWL